MLRCQNLFYYQEESGMSKRKSIIKLLVLIGDVIIELGLLKRRKDKDKEKDE